MRLGATRSNTKSQQWGPYDGYFYLMAEVIYCAEDELWSPVEFSIDKHGRFAFVGGYDMAFKSAISFIRACKPLKKRLDGGPRSMVACAIRARDRIKKRIELCYEKRGKDCIMELQDDGFITISGRKGFYYCWAYVTNQRHRHAEINGINTGTEHTFIGEAT